MDECFLIVSRIVDINSPNWISGWHSDYLAGLSTTNLFIIIGKVLFFLKNLIDSFCVSSCTKHTESIQTALIFHILCFNIKMEWIFASKKKKRRESMYEYTLTSFDSLCSILCWHLAKNLAHLQYHGPGFFSVSIMLMIDTVIHRNRVHLSSSLSVIVKAKHECECRYDSKV